MPAAAAKQSAHVNMHAKGHLVGNSSSYIFTLLSFFIAQPMSLEDSAAILENWPKAGNPLSSGRQPTSLQ